MANAVVAVFDEYDEAQSTVNELLVAGFDKNEVRLSAENEVGATQPTDDDRRQRPRERGVKGFFQSLFGINDQDDDVRIYDEAIRHGNYVVTAIAETPEKSELASEVMSHHHPVDIDERSSEWLGSSEQGINSSEAVTESTTIPVIEEEVKVGKREVQRGGVRIFQRVSDVEVERTGADQYRSHWQQTYGSQGGRYEEYEPAYEYGSTAAKSQLYRGREWDLVEPELRSDWESRYPSSGWERFKDSIKHAFGSRK